MEVTKEQFERFVKLQKSGVINMTDIVRGAKLSKLDEEIYEEIMFNYKELKSKFNL